LVGDSSDNIPGVAGIGPKKASDLIKKYGWLDQIYAHLDDLPPDLKQKLQDNREMAYMSRWLVDLCMIPEFSTKLSDLYCKIDFDRYKEVLVRDLKFSSMEKTLDEMKKKFIMPQQTSLF
jgi:DNA polymerase-1